MSTLLDHALFKLLPAFEEKQYANVSNILDVVLPEWSGQHYIEVGTSLFTFMRWLGIEPEEQVTLYLDVVDSSAVFGLFVGEDRIYDLWSVHPKRLPSWIGDEDHCSFVRS